MNAKRLPGGSPFFARSVDVYLPGPRRPSPPLVPGSSDARNCSTGRDKLFISVPLPGGGAYIDTAGDDYERAAAFLSSLE